MFKFEIGEILVHRASLIPPAQPFCLRLFVLERFSQECPGGVQVHYRCRVVGAGPDEVSLSRDLASFNEVELAPYAAYIKVMAETARFEAALERATAADLEEKLADQELQEEPKS
jgi:hypothetical protein